MKVLVFEFISGGGLAAQPLPVSLAREGAMMLQGLLSELKRLPAVEAIILADRRCAVDDLPERATIVYIERNQSYLPVLEELLPECDLFWPIAPETQGTLCALAELAASYNVTSVSSAPSALRLCASKYQTCARLQESGIESVATGYLTADSRIGDEQMVIKPDDGVGCEGSLLVSDDNSLQEAVGRIDRGTAYVIQPYLPGRSLSLSCLFRDGRGWLLCCNEQRLLIDDCGRFRLTACRVNVALGDHQAYRRLVERIAASIPGLWGYAGIDLIETERQGPVVLEINPRLTTSYCGIGAATGINVAEQILGLLHSEPVLHCSSKRTVVVDMNAGLQQ